MTNETPQTIRAWIDETFPNASQRARVRRAIKEMLELDEAVERGAQRSEMMAEYADFEICRDGLDDDEYAAVGRVYHALRLLNRGLPPEIDADIVELDAAKTAKMAINRARVWDIGADGTGQHRPGGPLGAQLNDAALQIRKLSGERDALAQTVERVREWAETVTDWSPDVGFNWSSGYLSAQEGVLAILDNKEG